MRPYETGGEKLFSSGMLSDTLDAQLASATSAVRQIPSDQFLKTTIDTMTEHFVAKYSVSPLVLDVNSTQIDPGETKVEVRDSFNYDIRPGERLHIPGQKISFFVPFTGDSTLFKLRPNQWSGITPAAIVGQRQLTITLVGTLECTPESFQELFRSTISGISEYVRAQRSLIEGYQARLPVDIRRAIEARRAELEKVQGLATVFSFPLVKKPGMPDFKPVELTRRPPPSLPRTTGAPVKPEPAIPDETYEDLLRLIRHAGASFESAPQTYNLHGEDGLRDIVLSHINATYTGKATAEAFRKYGKTDIRLEEGSRSAFVAECKVWKGEKVLLAALDQLLGYLTWRDTKAALIMFNQHVAGFSSIQETIPGVLKSHKGFLREKHSPANQAGEWRYVFKSTEDEAREVTVHVFAFNLYVAPDRAGKTR